MFWELTPYKLKPFLKAERYKTKKQNEMCWILGQYIYNAVSVAVYNNFRGKKHRPQKYIEEPMQLFELEDWEKEEKAERERKKAIAFFNSLEQNFRRKEES